MARSIVLLITGLALGALIVYRLLISPSMSPAAEAAMVEFLRTNCELGEDGHVEAAIRQFGSELEGPLIQLFQNGPAARDLQEVEAEARTQFRETQAAIRGGLKTGLPASDQAKVIGLNEEAYVKQVSSDYDYNRRVAALNGLEIGGGAKGRRILNGVAADPKSPYQQIAQAILENERVPKVTGTRR